ncbi:MULTISPECIES: hypothetical protein [Sphingomonas]|uniref:DksA C4-type domain-containing protein n=1 Tax=Sphingomonas zeae TaxID=1646122 RepID=A0A7Y6EFP7_9SPHN|nr:MULTISPECIES: hypothetical protein [Sphingomonas]MBB4049601.1 bacterioferritin-associated ferredoxin [Sphingomonas zeae]MDK8188026.1 hypothetical protein [Sphingomonas zeae]MDK8217906.1 hypothetical protein [Sphingomonas sp. UMB7805-LC452B]NUU45983.1 hypothetical protein [Sphingomonas zeae]
MADHIDMANEVAEAEAARGIAAAQSANHPVGIEGECDQCGDHFTRLVKDHLGYRCGYCRDGRRKPR